MPKYEVAIYNSAVRDAMARGQQHDSVSSDWASTRYIEITALNEEGARAKASRQYPDSQGFVIDGIFEA